MFPLRESIPRRLYQFYRLTRRHFGYEEQWWPGSPDEIALTAILVQQCDWSIVWERVKRLRAAGRASLIALAESSPAEVLEQINGVSFAPTKAVRLVEFARSVVRQGFRDITAYLSPDDDTAQLRTRLLRHVGVGEETADCLLLFSSAHASFVIDAYTRRVFERLDLFPELGRHFWRQRYGRLKEFFEMTILGDLSLYDEFQVAAGVSRQVALFRDFHAQIAEVGRHHCLKRVPNCHRQGKAGWSSYSPCRGHCRETCPGCPLADTCKQGSGAR